MCLYQLVIKSGRFRLTVSKLFERYIVNKQKKREIEILQNYIKKKENGNIRKREEIRVSNTYRRTYRNEQ